MATAKRAYGREDKAARRGAILLAATDLFGRGLGELPSVGDIAARSGIAKGTVYLYFRTKEAIFSALLLEGWGKVVDLLEEAFNVSDSGNAESVARFLSTYVTYLKEHRELLRLDALRPVLEQNLVTDALREFKQTFMARLIVGGASIDRALELPPGRGVKLLMRTYALTCGLWQMSGSHVTPKLDWGDPAHHADFCEELPDALTEYWRGALAQANS